MIFRNHSNMLICCSRNISDYYHIFVETFLINKDALNWSKVTVKTLLFQIKAVLLNFLFICESWKIKCITGSTKILGSITVFNTDNNQKLFLSSKSAYYYDFWRSCDTEDWSNDAENTDLITEINYTLLYIHIENSSFKW